jgi:hypothetical protein
VSHGPEPPTRQKISNEPVSSSMHTRSPPANHGSGVRLVMAFQS